MEVSSSLLSAILPGDSGRHLVLCCFPSVHGDSNRHLLLSFKLRCLFLGLAKAVDGFLGVVIFIVFPQRLVLRVGGLSCESLCASEFGIEYDSCMVLAELFVPRFCVCVSVTTSFRSLHCGLIRDCPASWAPQQGVAV